LRRFNGELTVVPAPTHAATSLAWGAGLGDSVAGDEAAFTVLLRDRYENDRGAGGEGPHITLYAHRTTEIQQPFWNDLMSSGLKFPETRIVEDYNNGTYAVRYTLVPAISYKLRIVFNATAEWPELEWPSTAVPTVTDAELRFLMFGDPDEVFAGDLITGDEFSIVKSPRPAPELLWSKFDDSLIRVRAKFSNETDLANMTRGSPCSLVIHPNMLVTLGQNPVCTWATSDELVISLGQGALITTTASYNRENDPEAFLDWDGQFRIQEAVLLGFYGNTYAVFGSAPVSNPDNAISPVAVLEAPNMVGLCDDTVFNAALSYGAGPRTLDYAWTSTDHLLHTTAYEYRCESAAQCEKKDAVVEQCSCIQDTGMQPPSFELVILPLQISLTAILHLTESLLVTADKLRDAEYKCNAAGEYALHFAGLWRNAKCDYSTGTCVAKAAAQCATITGAALDDSTACENLNPGVLDTVDIPDSCTSTLVAAPYTVTESDTVNCQLNSGDASFDSTGSCTPRDASVTCTYVGGLYSAGGSECTYITEQCTSVCAVVVPDRTGANCLAAGTHCVWTAPIGSCMNSDGELVGAATQAECEATTRHVWTETQAETCIPSDSGDSTACNDVMATPTSRDTVCAAALGGGRCVHVPKACVATHANTCAQLNFAFERDVCESRQGAECTGTADDATVSRTFPSFRLPLPFIHIIPLTGVNFPISTGLPKLRTGVCYGGSR
jgi:hypothetical protein